jgi:hypothetical protein
MFYEITGILACSYCRLYFLYSFAADPILYTAKRAATGKLTEQAHLD